MNIKIVEKLSTILSKIPLDKWNEIVENEPEWKYMYHIFASWKIFGKFSTLMVILGLNDFQLKGKAEKAYWPKIKELLERREVPNSLDELENILLEFFSKERLPYLKIKRLKKFLSSEISKKLWQSNSEEIEKNFQKIWSEIANVMNQKRKLKL